MRRFGLVLAYLLLTTPAWAMAARPKPPLVLTCPAAVIAATLPGAKTAVVTYPPATASGGTQPYTFTYSVGSGAAFQVGVTTVTVTVSDAMSHVASCGFTVTVTATPAPILPSTLTASASTIQAGQAVTLTLTNPSPNYHNVTVNGAPMVFVDCATAAGPCVFTLTATPSVTTTYQTAAIDPTATPYPNMPSVTVTVTAPPPPQPTLTTTANPLSLTAGQSSVVTLTTPGSTRTVFNVALNGQAMTFVACTTACTYTATVTPTQTTTYTPTGTDATGAAVTIPSVTVTVTAPPPPPPPSGGGSTGTLIQASNLVEVGTFSAPTGISDSNCSGTTVNDAFTYANGQIGFNPATNSLFVADHDWCQHVGEISIPAIGGVASLLQPLVDPYAGKINSVDTDGENAKVGGLYVTGSTLVMSAYIYYDGAGDASSSHFTRPTTLSTGTVVGPLRVGTMNPGFVGGYFAPIPAAWQAALGGDLLVGQCCLSVISRTSYGPAAFAVATADLLAGKNPTAAQPLVYYDQSHTTLGGWGDVGPDPTFNMTTQVKGAFIAPGWQSLLFFGVTGTGKACYGAGTSDPSLDGQPVPGETGVIYCYDPANGAKGTHAYPYTGYVWAYNLADLAAVKAGTKQPWDVVPYATWPMAFNAVGATYDAATGRLFLSGYGPNGLIIHQLKIQ